MQLLRHPAGSHSQWSDTSLASRVNTCLGEAADIGGRTWTSFQLDQKWNLSFMLTGGLGYIFIFKLLSDLTFLFCKIGIQISNSQVILFGDFMRQELESLWLFNELPFYLPLSFSTDSLSPSSLQPLILILPPTSTIFIKIFPIRAVSLGQWRQESGNSFFGS